MGTGGSKKISEQRSINSFMDRIQRCINVFDFEVGDGKGAPQFANTGNGTFEIKMFGNTFQINVSIKK